MGASSFLFTIHSRDIRPHSHHHEKNQTSLKSFLKGSVIEWTVLLIQWRLSLSLWQRCEKKLLVDAVETIHLLKGFNPNSVQLSSSEDRLK